MVRNTHCFIREIGKTLCGLTMMDIISISYQGHAEVSINSFSEEKLAYYSKRNNITYMMCSDCKNKLNFVPLAILSGLEL